MSIPAAAPDATPLKPNILKWSVTADGQTLTYGDVHSMIHRDISIGNDYRKERIKLLSALATGVFALTVTFHKDLFAAKVTSAGLIWLLAGWSLLLISLLAGIEHFKKWEDFYLQHRTSGIAVWRFRTATDDSEKKLATIDFNASEKKINDLRNSYKRWNLLQSYTLLAGLLCIGIYVGLSALNIPDAGVSRPSGPPAVGGATTPPPAKKE